MTGRAPRIAGFLGFLVFAVLGAASMSRDSGDFDYWQHLSAIRILSSNLLRPPPLLFSEPYEVHLYTPYHLFWAFVLHALGTSIWYVVIIMAAVNAGLFALGTRLLARHLFKDRGLDFVVLVTLLVFWGSPIWWSGVYSLGQVPLQVAYPSFFALAVSMIVGALWLEEGYRSFPTWVVFGICIAVLVATHPITTSFLLLFLFMKTLFLSSHTRGDLLSSTLCVAGGCALGLLWPYYSLGTLIMAARGGPDFLGDFEIFYSELPGRLGLEVLGFLALPFVKPGRRRRFLGALLLVCFAIYSTNYALHLSHIFSRYLIFTTFALQLSVVAAVSCFRQRRIGRVVLPLFVLLAVVGAGRQLRIATLTSHGLAKDLATGMALGTHSVRNQYVGLERLGEGDGDHRPIMMAPLDWAYRVTAMSGFQVVGVASRAPTMSMSDYEERRRDVTRFYNPESSSNERAEIIRRRGVVYVLLESEPDHKIVSRAWRPVLQTTRFSVYSTDRRRGRMVEARNRGR